MRMPLSSPAMMFSDVNVLPRFVHGRHVALLAEGAVHLLRAGDELVQRDAAVLVDVEALEERGDPLGRRLAPVEELMRMVRRGG